MQQLTTHTSSKLNQNNTHYPILIETNEPDFNVRDNMPALTSALEVAVTKAFAHIEEGTRENIHIEHGFNCMEGYWWYLVTDNHDDPREIEAIISSLNEEEIPEIIMEHCEIVSEEV